MEPFRNCFNPDWIYRISERVVLMVLLSALLRIPAPAMEVRCGIRFS